MEFKVPVGISNRHIHLSNEHIEALFGIGYKLNKTKDLNQPGEFACEETVKLVGPKGTLANVRVLGPARKATQVEISATDSYVLGIKPPVKDSGDHDGTPGVDIIGPKGTVQIEQGAMIAARHIHMTNEDAQKIGLANGNYVNVKAPGIRGGIMENVLIRVSPNFQMELHIDNDEGNAFGVVTGQSLDVIIQ